MTMTIEDDKAARVQELRGDAMKGTVDTVFHVFQPDRKRHTEVRHAIAFHPGLVVLESIIKPLLGFDVESMEHVAVLYQGRASDMFVDELGAISTMTRSQPKPINPMATAIYHAYAKSVGQDMRHAPSIHGVAVIAMRKVWF